MEQKTKKRDGTEGQRKSHLPVSPGKRVYFKVIMSCHGEWNSNEGGYCQTVGAAVQRKSWWLRSLILPERSHIKILMIMSSLYCNKATIIAPPWKKKKLPQLDHSSCAAVGGWQDGKTPLNLLQVKLETLKIKAANKIRVKSFLRAIAVINLKGDLSLNRICSIWIANFSCVFHSQDWNEHKIVGTSEGELDPTKNSG